MRTGAMAVAIVALTWWGQANSPATVYAVYTACFVGVLLSLRWWRVIAASHWRAVLGLGRWRDLVIPEHAPVLQSVHRRLGACDVPPETWAT